MDNTEKMMICSCGYQSPEGTKFCPECGTPLPAEQVPMPIEDTSPSAFPAGIGIMDGSPFPPAEDDNSVPPDDKGLKMLIDCCRKSIATGCGDSHDEVVLYLDEKTGEYQIHTYSLGFGSHKEKHRGYKTVKEAYDKAMEIILGSGLPEYEGAQGIPMCGGEYVCKFLYEDRMIRLTTAVVPYPKQGALYSVEAAVRGYISRENELFGNT